MGLGLRPPAPKKPIKPNIPGSPTDVKPPKKPINTNSVDDAILMNQNGKPINEILETIRTGVVEPTVSNKKLNHLVGDLYKGAKKKNPIGTGSTADSIRSEVITGQPTYGKFHTEKGQQYVRALNSLVKSES